MSPYACPVCGQPVIPETDYMGYVLMEECDTCHHCELFHYQQLTGLHYERNGWCEEHWTWNTDKQDYEEILTRTRMARTEAQKLHKHPDWPLWKRTLTARPDEEPDLFLAFSDWLQEQELELQAEAVRGLVKGNAEWTAERTGTTK